MDAYAVVETGGRQYMVKAGDTFEVNRMAEEKGATVQLNPVLALSDGKQLKIGQPEVAGAKVTATIVDHVRGDKVISFRKYRRKGYSRKRGHRQELTVLKIQAVG